MRFLVIRLLGLEWLRVEFGTDEVTEFVDACLACEDSGDPCAVCGDEDVDE